MLKKFLAVAFAMMIAMTATVAGAQCTIAAYADAAGTDSHLAFTPDFGMTTGTYSLYVVIFTEDTAAAASYQMFVPGLGTETFIQSRSTGSSNLVPPIDEATGTNVALGECVLGYNGFPILIDTYDMFAFDTWAGGLVTFGPNTSQDPDFPVYVTCGDVIKPCGQGPALVIQNVVPNDSKSFGSIKALY